MIILFLLVVSTLSALTLEEKYAHINMVPYIHPSDIYVRYVEPSDNIHTQYDEYIRKYRQEGFEGWNMDPQYSWTFFLQGNKDNAIQYQSYHLYLQSPGQFMAQISRLYSNHQEIQPPGFDFFIYRIYTGHVPIAIQIIYAKVVKIVLEEGDYLLVFRNRDDTHKRIRFQSGINYNYKDDPNKNTTGDPLDQIVNDLQIINNNVRNFMNHHTQDLAQANIHAQMQSINSLKQYGYAILEVLVIFILNVIQLIYIRKLLSKKVLVI